MPTLTEWMITIDAEPLSSWTQYHTYYPDKDWNEWKHYYEGRVLAALRTISSTKSGQALTHAIRRPITIIPLHVPTDHNAYTQAADLGGTEKGTPGGTLGKGGAVVNGTGAGAASTIQFTPDTWIPGNPLYYRHWRQMINMTGGDGPDEYLFHELVHAVRNGHGHGNHTPMGDGYDNLDDFYAILFTNIYSSELGRPLRLDHHGHSLLQHSDAGPSRFYDKYTGQIAKCCADMPQFSKRIAEVNCPFNPIREHYVYSIPVAGPVILGLTRSGPPAQGVELMIGEVTVRPIQRGRRRRTP